MEIWRTIEIAPKYEVSNKGLIRNKDTNNYVYIYLINNINK